MTGRHESPPAGSAAREATAPPYIGKRRAEENPVLHWPPTDEELDLVSPGYLRSSRMVTSVVICPQCDSEKFSLNIRLSRVECLGCGLVLDTPGGIWE